ncbi:MAG TPA: type II toxin-antitoxin system HicB family antitoxin [Gemmataceae bacterium]|nr:type II toxin-antitoxin system HicB family antitoxin [Gemmataceae bacterium]
MPLTVEVEQEDDGRWLAEAPELPGVLAYGPSRAEAVGRVEALALRVLADRIEAGEPVPQMGGVFAVSP